MKRTKTKTKGWRLIQGFNEGNENGGVRLGFLNGKLSYDDGTGPRPVTVRESLIAWAKMERESDKPGLDGETKYPDGAWDKNARVRWLRMVAAEIPA